jgi:hypothetical protein
MLRKPYVEVVLMKTASLGLLEVKWYVRMPGEGDHGSPLVSPGAEDSSLFYFWREEPLGFAAIFSWTDVEALFLAS